MFLGEEESKFVIRQLKKVKCEDIFSELSSRITDFKPTKRVTNSSCPKRFVDDFLLGSRRMDKIPEKVAK